MKNAENGYVAVVYTYIYRERERERERVREGIAGYHLVFESF
jgi:hypothetical protein